MKTALKISVGVLFAVTACTQLTAKSLTVATVLSTPQITVPAGAIATGPVQDAGIAIDAGTVENTFSDAGFTIGAQNLVYLFFGERQGDTLDVAPVGIAGAKVTLVDTAGASWPLTDVGSGTYQLSGQDAGFRYTANATYDFKIVSNDVTYTAEVEKVPAPELISQFHTAAGYIDQAANQPLTFTRPEPVGGEDLNLGFVTVLPILAGSSSFTPTYTNVPMQPLEILKLVLAPEAFKTTSVTIPASAFPSASANYVILFQSVKLGGPKSENLFTGSAILAGTAEVAVVKTH